MKDYFTNAVKELSEVAKSSFESHEKNLSKIIDVMSECLINKNKIILFGNGGSAADSQHIAAEFVVRLKDDRCAYPAIAFTTDTSVITACGNDIGFDRIFARQVEALAVKGDVIIALSTSGNSENVIQAIAEAKKKDIFVIAFTGEGGGKMKDMCDILVDIKSKKSMRIQEVYMSFLHGICELVEQKAAGGM